MQKKYTTGLIIGRFQPFHNGHKHLIKKALEHCEKVIIAIGSANKNDSNNPFSYTIRKKFIQEFIKHEQITDRVAKIIPSPDIPDDYVWRDTLLQKTGKIDVVISNNDDGVNIFFEEAGYPILRIGFHNREELEGQQIRKLLREQKSWENRVPNYLIPHIVASFPNTA